MTDRTYTHPDVLTSGVAEGWAETETDPARIDWPARQARAAIPFEVVNGRPVNPCEKTAVRYGRNHMGLWGEHLTADALVTATFAGCRVLLMVERRDGYGWAIPGGHAEPGETGLQAAIRELAEETGLDVTARQCEVMPPRYVPDPRASDEAWAVTVPVHVDLGEVDVLPEVMGGDDARRAEWIAANGYTGLTRYLATRYDGTVFVAHTGMLRDFLGEQVPGTSLPRTESSLRLLIGVPPVSARMEAGMTDHGPDDMGDDEQETEVAEYEQYIEDPPEELVIAEDNDDDAEEATDWAARHPRQLRAEDEEEPDDEAAEDAAIHVTDEP